MEKRHRGRSDPDFLEEPAVRSLFCSAAQCQSGYDDLRYRPYGRCDRRRDLGRSHNRYLLHPEDPFGLHSARRWSRFDRDGRRGVPLQPPRLDVVHDQAGALLDGRRQPVAGVCLRIGQRAAYGNLCSRERNIRYAVHGADDALLADGQDHGCRLHRLQRHAAYRHSELP